MADLFLTDIFVDQLFFGYYYSFIYFHLDIISNIPVLSGYYYIYSGSIWLLLFILLIFIIIRILLVIWL